MPRVKCEGTGKELQESAGAKGVCWVGVPRLIGVPGKGAVRPSDVPGMRGGVAPYLRKLRAVAVFLQI